MSENVDLWATIDCHCLAARRDARAITRLYEEKLRPHGLRATQFSILAALALKGPTPVSDMADFLGLERTTMSRSSALLEQQGLLASAATSDARKRLLRLTDEGRKRLEKAYPAWREVQDMLDEGSKGKSATEQSQE